MTNAQVIISTTRMTHQITGVCFSFVGTIFISCSIGGSGRIRTYGEFPHDSFQDCSDKPDSGTLPKFLVEGLGFEPRLAASKTAILPLDDPSIERSIILTFTVKVKY